MPTINRNTNRSATGINIGDTTHHQLQSMYFVNFKVMNTIVSNPANPIPPDDVEFLLIFFSFNYYPL